MTRDEHSKLYSKNLPVVVDYSKGQSQCIPTTDSTMNDHIIRARYGGMKLQQPTHHQDPVSGVKDTIIGIIGNLFHYW